MSSKLYQFLKIHYIVKSQKECELKLNDEYTKLVGKATVTCVAYKVKGEVVKCNDRKILVFKLNE